MMEKGQPVDGTQTIPTVRMPDRVMREIMRTRCDAIHPLYGDRCEKEKHADHEPHEHGTYIWNSTQ